MPSFLLSIASVGLGQVDWQPQAFLLWPEQHSHPTPGWKEHAVLGRDFLSLVLCSPAVPLALGSFGLSVYSERVCMSACM